MLMEEASIRKRVKEIQNSLSTILKALGEMAIANPIFAHSQLPSLVCFQSFYHFRIIITSYT